ncbi:hypothetical protein [Caulobacter vibrioides]|nr:hypothetical protein [Caulobacter vibrioides]AVH77115.1 hypothetical protein CA607_20170 [Caulobacter vibrioides]QXZ53899.1 hypothetical protein KZH45_00510 [Caulobacter vibrioides]
MISLGSAPPIPSVHARQSP